MPRNYQTDADLANDIAEWLDDGHQDMGGENILDALSLIGHLERKGWTMSQLEDNRE